MHQIVCRLGLCLRPHWGELPALLAIFRGPTSKERGDEGENKKGGKGREGKGELGREGKDRGGEGRRGSSYFALGRKKEVGDYDRNCE